MARKVRGCMRQRRGDIVYSKINKIYGAFKPTIAGIRKDIHNWHKGRKDITKIYIGKNRKTKKSINAAYDAMQTRVDGYKRGLKITDMKLLHIGSARNVDQAERQLVRYNMSQGRKARNQTGGGGGAPTEGRHHVLYAALKTTKRGIKKRTGKHKLR